MNDRKKVVLVVACAMLALAGCGPRAKKSAARASVADRQTSVPAPAPQSIPVGTSVTSANQKLIGSFEYLMSQCSKTDGTSIPIEFDTPSPEEYVIISDQELVSDMRYSSGCRVISTYSIVGVDQKTIAISNRRTVAMSSLTGGLDYSGECKDELPTSDASKVFKIEYLVKDDGISLLWGQIAPCEAGEQWEDAYLRR